MGIFSCVSSPGSVLSIFVTNCDMSEGVEGSPTVQSTQNKAKALLTKFSWFVCINVSSLFKKTFRTFHF